MIKSEAMIYDAILLLVIFASPIVWGFLVTYLEHLEYLKDKFPNEDELDYRIRKGYYIY